MEGWVILWPDGYPELIHFHTCQFRTTDNKNCTPDEWRVAHRPNCKLVRASICVPPQPLLSEALEALRAVRSQGCPGTLEDGTDVSFLVEEFLNKYEAAAEAQPKQTPG